MLKITTRSIVDELKSRGVPVEILEERYGLVRYRVGDQWRLLRSSITDEASWLGGFIARDKRITHALLEDEDLRQPATVSFENEALALGFMNHHEQIVVKPTDGGHGNGVTVGVRTESALHRAIVVAKQASRGGEVILQEQVSGNDIRVLIIGGSFAAGALRIPAEVTGDGEHTIRQLIDLENNDNVKRGNNYSKRLNFIDHEAAERFLGERIDNGVPAQGEVVRVAGPANIGAGGTSVNVTDKIPAGIIKKAERVAELLKLPTCGVDFMVSDAEDAASYRFIEVNACPSFGLHLFPAVGEPEPVAEAFVNHLLQEAK